MKIETRKYVRPSIHVARVELESGFTVPVWMLSPVWIGERMREEDDSESTDFYF
ncbi:MAG: hypothetical protein LBH19_11990 [Dysgonamonadaceae bacterium]|jgi:hypothetical protein|nr:hypothetical protein [Dysgonamonadaceae bacterium]